MLDKSTIEKVISNTPLALVLIGLLLVVIGAAGGWPSPALQVNESGWRIALAAMGVVVVGVGGLLLWREKAPPASTPSCEVYGIKIVYPRNGQEVEADFEIYGTYKTKPPNEKIVQVFHGPPGTPAYWPIIEAKVNFDVERKTWHTGARIGGNPAPRDIVVALMEQAGQALCDYYHKVGEETGKWPGIITLTPDIVECDRVTIKRK